MIQRVTLKKMENEESDSDCPSDDEYDKDLQREEQNRLSEQKEMLQSSISSKK